MQARPVGQRGVDERRADVDTTPRALEHPLDQVAHLPVTESERAVLGDAVAGDEDTVGGVDPDLLDLRIVQEGLERTEARQARDHLPRGLDLIAEQRHGAAERELAVPTDLVPNEASHERRVGGQVGALPSDAVADLFGDRRDGGGHAAMIATAAGRAPPLSTARH